MSIEAFIVNIQQGTTQDITGWIFQFIWLLAFVIVWIYGQRIQTTLMLKEIEGSLSRLKVMRDRGRQLV
ncbi:MAG: hypothetical protein QXU95_04885, partial [Candidatus Bathyarchaeia archaeon]